MNMVKELCDLILSGAIKFEDRISKKEMDQLSRKLDEACPDNEELLADFELAVAEHYFQLGFEVCKSLFASNDSFSINGK